MLVYYLYKYLKNKKKEGYANIEHLTPAEDAKLDLILFSASFIISIYAAYLFYNCGKKYSPIVRIIGSILAFYMGLIYIIVHFIYTSTGRIKCH